MLIGWEVFGLAMIALTVMLLLIRKEIRRIRAGMPPQFLERGSP